MASAKGVVRGGGGVGARAGRQVLFLFVNYFWSILISLI